MPYRIANWSVKRSGAGMTIIGKGASGEPVTVTKVDRIEGDRADGPIAILADGSQVPLA